MIRDRTKYGAVRTDGFASKREAHRYRELRLLGRSGVITGLECQVAFELQAPASTGTLATVGRYSPISSTSKTAGRLSRMRKASARTCTSGSAGISKSSTACPSRRCDALDSHPNGRATRPDGHRL